MDNVQIKYLLKLAADLISEGKKLHALQVYKRLINESEDEAVYFQIAELYEDLGFIDAGKNILFDLLSAGKQTEEVLLYTGQFLLRNKMWFEAIDVLNNLVKSIPSSSFLIGYCYFMLNEYELSKEYFELYLSFNEKDELSHQAKLYLAKIEYELNDFASALNYAQDAKYLYSDSWELSLILAKTYYSLKMYSHALNSISTALRSNSHNPDVMEIAGKIYFYLNDYLTAEKWLTECILNSENVSAEVYTLLAKSFLQQRKIEEAKKFFDFALLADPGYQPALKGRSELTN